MPVADSALIFAKAACAHAALRARRGQWAVLLDQAGELRLQRQVPAITGLSALEAQGCPVVGVYRADVPLPDFVADVRATFAQQS